MISFFDRLDYCAPLLVGCHDLLQSLHVGSGQVSNLALVLDEDEGWHGCDLQQHEECKY